MVEIDSLLVVNSIFSANSCSALDFVSVFECWHIFLEKYILIWLLREWYLHFEDSGDRYFQKCSSFVFQHRLYLFDLFGLDWVRAGWCAWAGLWSFYSQYILYLESEFFFSHWPEDESEQLCLKLIMYSSVVFLRAVWTLSICEKFYS